jgi:hypothetical protein
MKLGHGLTLLTLSNRSDSGFCRPYTIRLVKRWIGLTASSGQSPVRPPHVCLLDLPIRRIFAYRRLQVTMQFQL